MGLILNTRPTFYHDRFHAAFGELPWAIFDCPVTLGEPVAAGIPGPDAFDTVIFTSQLGVVSFAPGPEWLGKQVFAVGSGTAEAAYAVGFKNVVQTGLDVDDMRRYLEGADFKSALYPSGEDITADLGAEFPGRVRREVVYRMIPRGELPPQLLKHIRDGMPIVAPLFSVRGGEILASLLTKAGVTSDTARVAAIAISAKVMAASAGPWHREVIADEPSLGGLMVATGEAIEVYSTKGGAP